MTYWQAMFLNFMLVLIWFELYKRNGGGKKDE